MTKLSRMALANAMQDGREAARASYGRDACPYEPGSEAARWWQEGFNSIRTAELPEDRINTEPRRLPDWRWRM